MVEIDSVIIPFTGMLICQLLGCGYMYSKMKRRIRELESLVGEGKAQKPPIPSAPEDKSDYVVVPLGLTAPQNQYLGGVTFSPVQPLPAQQVPPRYW